MIMEKSKHVKIYDLQGNFITEFYTFKEAGQFMGVDKSTVLYAVKRKNPIKKTYIVKSEGQKFRGFKHKVTTGTDYQLLVRKYNKKRCLIKYKDPEHEALSIIRSREISDIMHNKKRCRELTDNYIICAIDKHLGIKRKDVTQQMINAKRKQLEVLRSFKNDCI
jgi:hypothetical protein